ncbi:conserved hypothetical protein [Leishmania major strain Friedlin]|uniref:Uncharacterized protein n=1 Tax=Leishmania major TaxID=5664 RepID=Q4Q4Y6_LEIMA|nr:conserved hypothetical protein [Leishmania major strain Friedlin]CAG9580427.1 hypothetical_protein_-_conserved [Leishmania major strain Friedlin]CAJ08816.1 conserved hypothetical protein [Leishmania major strain Friedlin]|eukprot:XP_001685612.1 conserved hypothetical protein [Leishmania major strain Friedlin]
MPSSYVCILHSSNGHYTDNLVGNALRCVHALQCSVRTGAPDFIPSIAVFFADPHRGAKCVYSSAVPDRNHALDRLGATYPVLSDATGSVFSPEEDGGGGGTGGGTAERTVAFAQLFRLRSPQILQQAILRAAQEHNSTVPTAGARVDASSVKEFRETSTAPSASASPSPDAPNMWSSLAGALLASLCYLRAHSSSAFRAANRDEADAEAGEAPGEAASGDSSSSDAVNFAPPPRSAGSVLVFSDAKAAAVPPYSAECALAMAAVTASKMGVTVSCFGEAVVHTDSTENRLVALACSLGGFCAGRFSLHDLGHLLDGASAAVSLIGSRARQRRDRIASQYVVGPTMLPQAPLRKRRAVAAALAEDSTVDFKRATTEEVDTAVALDAKDDEHASYLGWLCPSCMAVIYRPSTEVAVTTTSDSRTEDGGGSGMGQAMGPRCPYCSKV